MAWFIVIVWIIAFALNLYCGVLYSDLYKNGLTNEVGRVSLSKLNRALNSAKTEAQRNGVRYCKQCYIAFLSLFYIGITGAFIEVFHVV